jgi:hypothetical protein
MTKLRSAAPPRRFPPRARPWSATLALGALGACAASRPPAAAPAAAGAALSCAGQTIEYREEDPERGRLAITVRCEKDRLLVEERSEHGALICPVHADAAEAVWAAARRSDARRALLEAHRRASPPPAAESAESAESADGGLERKLDQWPFHGGSCPCPWPDDPTGAQCWSFPCRPPRPAPRAAGEAGAVGAATAAPAGAVTTAAECTAVVY